MLNILYTKLCLYDCEGKGIDFVLDFLFYNYIYSYIDKIEIC